MLVLGCFLEVFGGCGSLFGTHRVILEALGVTFGAQGDHF